MRSHGLSGLTTRDRFDIPQSPGVDERFDDQGIATVGARRTIGFDHEEDARRFHVSPGRVTLVTPDMLGQSIHHIR